MLIYPVVLSGGAGTRLWPLSRAMEPKQFLPLATDRTMIQETVLRVSGNGFAAPIVVCNQEHRFLVAEQMREAGVKPQAIVLEQMARNTAPAAAIAALLLKDKPDALMLVLPTDHVIGKPEAFLAAIRTASEAAKTGALATFGIPPRRPETDYGYIRRGTAVQNSASCHHVAEFVEKPCPTDAEAYLASGEYYWNSGMFLFRPDTYLDELARLAPAVLSASEAALAGSRLDTDFLRLDSAAFEACPTISIDHAVMEHTQRAVVVPADIEWNDIGSWWSLWEAVESDADGNVKIGRVTSVRSQNSYLRSEGPLIAAAGTENLIVVATKDAVLVSGRDHAQDVKKIVEALQADGDERSVHHPRVLRPWGSYETVDLGANYQVKHIVVKPGARLSLQMHHKRAEHWVVVSGTARVTSDEKVFDLEENRSTFIPLGSWHRIENPGREPLHLIEVQLGSYLGEDDIVRRQDDYGR